MNLQDRFTKHIQKQRFFLPDDKLILAVSGGIDSVSLCELCKKAGFDFTIAHCNFQLRGPESERDEKFVLALGDRYQVDVAVKKFDTERHAVENKTSIQEAARTLRYEWFEELINQSTNPPINYLLTAHHADDNIETLLMNFFRGTGLHGLTGIPEKTNYIRRPLLPFTREELLLFAREHNLQWVEDSSNESSKYTRNYFRNELIPALMQVFPKVRDNLQENLKRFREIEALYRLSVDAMKQKFVTQKGNELHIPVKRLLGFENRALIYEVISGYGFTEKQIDEVIKLAESGSGKYISSPDGSYRIIRHRHWLIINPAAPGGSGHFIIEEGQKALKFAGVSLHIKTQSIINCPLPVDTSTACLDLGEIVFPLILRQWKTGDYFYPLGMKKKKKVSRFLIDQKLSKVDKEKVWVIESNKRIVWVVGYRIDERFKLTEKTKQALQFTLQA
jgi:tRNA(Ile)-lysidine synthase